ncbi:uncharacterized protein MELLADRAFT_108757 [Melampsora larici-populina 98AG31]|uniref:Uncharacterized protein n=1 Tax=Melampsora larici-populina (strain 98AG31 / pathotype 3-4-7) TaxID=747676 RepID=F4RU53_MELLP|nr:uncharacterized protein MELLADRAFT_108757 [Melampsora larici-populina 98AG31]EGG04142.1 hypothetical protein MELLADRAFT_108757 [Melampsora larici-populina 98AG31]
MTSANAPKPESLKDKLISSNTEVVSVFGGRGPSDRKHQCEEFFKDLLELPNRRLNSSHLSVTLNVDDLVQELQSKKSSKEELEELKSLCYQKLQLLVGIEADDDKSLDSAIKDFQGILGHRQLIKDNTRAINFSFETASYPEHKSVSRTEKTKNLLKKVEELFQTVDPQSITNLRWELGRSYTGRSYSFDIYDPKQVYSTSSKNLLQIVSTFTNLVTFQYISRDTQSTFEEMVSKTLASLPNLEVLVISREETDVYRWIDECRCKLSYEEEIGKLMGESLSSLTKLKRLHLQGLIAPRQGWGGLDWKCPLEYLKVTECPRLYGEAIFSVAKAFRKTLLGLLLGPEISQPHEIPQPKIEFGKEFVVLEDLSVRAYLGMHEETRLIDVMSQAPKLKHFDIHANETDVLSRIKEQIEQPGSAWASLQTLGVDAPDKRDYSDSESDEEEGFVLLDEKLKTVSEFVSHKFGLLDAEWDWPRRDDHKVKYNYGKMTLANGKVIEIKAQDVYLRDRTSLQYLDTVELIPRLSS